MVVVVAPSSSVAAWLAGRLWVDYPPAAVATRARLVALSRPSRVRCRPVRSDDGSRMSRDERRRPRRAHPRRLSPRRVVPMTWGLDTFVAANPLHGFEDRSFEDAALAAADLFDARVVSPVATRSGRVQLVTERDPRRPSERLVRVGTGAVADVVDALVAHWCATHRALVEHADPGSRPDLYAELAASGSARSRPRQTMRTGHRDRARALPVRAAGCRRRRSSPHAGSSPPVPSAISRPSSLASPGWAAAFAREVDTGARTALVEFAATRLAVEHLLVAAAPAGPTAGSRPARRRGRRRAQDRSRRRRGTRRGRGRLSRRPARTPGHGRHRGRRHVATEAQLVFCIDVRSEGIRRPSRPPGHTRRSASPGSSVCPSPCATATQAVAVPHCPVILDPRASVIDPGRHHDDAVHDRFVAAKTAPTSGYVLADAAGWLLGAATLGTSLAPRWWARLTRSLTRTAGARRGRSRHRPVGGAAERHRAHAATIRCRWRCPR